MGLSLMDEAALCAS